MKRDERPDPDGLSRRERQILDILFRRGEASAADVRAALPDPPSYSAVRALLRILEEKGHARHREEGGRYLFAPAQSRQSAARRALRQVVQTFFGGSVEGAVSTLLSADEARLTDDEVARLSALIERAAARGADSPDRDADTTPDDGDGEDRR